MLPMLSVYAGGHDKGCKGAEIKGVSIKMPKHIITTVSAKVKRLGC